MNGHFAVSFCCTSVDGLHTIRRTKVWCGFGPNLFRQPECSAQWALGTEGWVKGAEGPNDSRFLPLFSFFHCYCRLCSICAAPQRPQGGDLSVSRISVHNTMSGLQTRDAKMLRFCSCLPLSIYLWCPAVRTLSISPALLIFSPMHVSSSLSRNMETARRNELWAH